MKQYRCIGEITQSSALYGTSAASVTDIADSFHEARTIVQSWLDYDHERLDHAASRAPMKAGTSVTDGDWTYSIEKVENV